jgi:putative salt-induced outer membrane protein YdiY
MRINNMRVYDGTARARSRAPAGRAMRAGWALFGVLWLSASALADTVVLRNGDLITGTITGFEAGRLVIRTEYAGEIKIDLSAIDTLASDAEVTTILKNETRVFGQISGDGEAIQVFPMTGGPTRTYPTLDLVGIEQGRMPEQALRFSGRINLGASSSSGNSSVTRMNLDAEVVARRRANRFTLGGRGTHASDRDRETESNATAYFKYDRFLTPRWYAYGSTTFEYDPFRDIELRSTLGLGSGYQFIESLRTNLAVETGLDYVRTDFDDGPDDDFPAARLALRFDHWMVENHVQFFHRSEGYASLEQIEQSFLRTQTGLRFPLVDRFLAQAQLNYDWDGNPQPGRESVDQTVVFSLGYKW